MRKFFIKAVAKAAYGTISKLVSVTMNYQGGYVVKRQLVIYDVNLTRSHACHDKVSLRYLANLVCFLCRQNLLLKVNVVTYNHMLCTIGICLQEIAMAVQINCFNYTIFTTFVSNSSHNIQPKS